MARRLVIAVAVVALGAVFAVPGANAAFGIQNWQALTCAENEDEGAVPGTPPLPQSAGQCTESTPGKYFTQAAGHPNFGITDFTLNTIFGFPEGFLRHSRDELPEGLSVNPQATPQCPIAVMEENKCPENTRVGTNYFTVALSEPPAEQTRVPVPVYNVVPFDGVPSMVAFFGTAGVTYIVGSLDPANQHVNFDVSDIEPPPGGPPVVGSRLVFDGRAGDGTYLTMPSNCGGGQTTILKVNSWEGASSEKSFTTSLGAEGCELVPFHPTINVDPLGGAVDSPEATTVTVGIPFDPAEPIANSYLKTAKVTLPEGMSINPASANGLVPCTDAQFGYHTDNPIGCPDASKIGKVEVQTPSLPANSLSGDVYVGQPQSNDPTTGEQFRIFIHAGSDRYGVNVRLIGHVFPNLATGQLTAVVDENPQATFKSFKLRFFGGAKGTLTSPPTCGPNVTNTVMTPWSGHADENEPTSSFTLTSDPTGGDCPTTLAGRKFTPAYSAKLGQHPGGRLQPAPGPDRSQ